MTTTHEPNESFEVADDHLIRNVVPRRSEPYEHRCPRATFEQIAVALALLKERGIVGTRYRRNYAATDGVHLDAMTEFYTLAEDG